MRVTWGTDVIVRSDGDTTAATGRPSGQAMQQMSRQQVEVRNAETIGACDFGFALLPRRFTRWILLAVFAGLALMLAQRWHGIGVDLVPRGSAQRHENRYSHCNWAQIGADVCAVGFCNKGGKAHN